METLLESFGTPRGAEAPTSLRTWVSGATADGADGSVLSLRGLRTDEGPHRIDDHWSLLVRPGRVSYNSVAVRALVRRHYRLTG